MDKIALITGINGQDGIFLSDLLLRHNYRVIGIGTSTKKTHHLSESVSYIQCDIRDTEKVTRICSEYQIVELYNLAGLSSVARSFLEPDLTYEINTRAILDILSSILASSKLRNIRCFQSSSSEMFGLSNSESQDERTPLNPVSPYARSKAETHVACKQLRDDGLFVTTGILFNHESYLRPLSFVTRKITHAVSEIALGNLDRLTVGNLDVERDWGFAGDFVRAVWLMMQSNEPEEFVVATGEVNSVRRLIQIAFDEAGLAGRESEFLDIDPGLFRPKEVLRLQGDPTKIRFALGWKPSISFEEMIREMVRYDTKK